MTPVAKPSKRAPKPRRRIARSSKPLARGKAPRQRRKGKTAGQRRECARLWSSIVMHGKALCACGCFRPAVDPAHVLGKKAWPSVRYYTSNGLALARECHDRMGSASVRAGWSEMRMLFIALRTYGEWERLVNAARRSGPKTADALAELRRQAVALGIQ